MARNIPKALATFVSNDTDTARMFNNLQSAIQPLLDFNNKWFQDKGSALNVRGALQAAGVAVSSGVTGALTSFRKVPDGTVAAPGLAFLTNATIGIEREGTGNAEQWNFIFNGVKVLSITKSGYIWRTFSSAAGLMLFNNDAGTLLGTLKNDGSLSLPVISATATPGLVSASGIKSGPLFMGVLTNVTLPASSSTPMQTLSPNGQGQFMTMPFAGSVVGYGYCTTSPNAGVAAYIGKNGTIVWNCQTSTAAGTNNATGGQASKGSYPFAVNDTLYFYARSTTTSTAAGAYVQAYIVVEMAG